MKTLKNTHIYQLIIYISLVGLSTFSIAKPSVSIEDYSATPAVSMLTISPNGNRIAFRQVTDKYDRYIVYSNVKNKMISSIDISETSPKKAYFINNDNIIIVAGKFQQTHGFYGTSPVHTNYAMSFNIKNQKLHRLLRPGVGIYDNQWGLGKVSGISPDHEFAYMPAYTGGVAFGEWQGLEYNLMKTRISNKRQPSIYAKGTEFTIDFYLNRQGKPIAREEFDNKANLYSVQRYDNNAWTTIFSKTTNIPLDFIQGVTSDNKKLIIQVVHNNQTVYKTMDLDDGTIASQPIFEKAGKSVDSIIKDINNVVFGVKYSGFTPEYQFFDDSITHRLKAVSKAFTNTSITLVDWTNDWKNIVVYIEGQESSGEYVLLNEKNEMSILMETRPNIPYTKINPITEIYYKASDGLKIPALLTTPIGWDKTSKLPAIVLVHGGPQSNDVIHFDWLAQNLATEGYLVIQPQFRGSTSFGVKHHQKGYGEWGNKMSSDLNDGINALNALGYIDTNNVCILGGSYGGYAALNAGQQSKNTYKCIISINGVSDLSTMIKNIKRRYGKNHWLLAYYKKLMATSKKHQLEQLSPVNFAESFQVPVLLFHGENDQVVPIKQSSSMHKALKNAGKASKLIKLIDENHYLEKAKNREVLLKEMNKFIKEHIGVNQ